MSRVGAAKSPEGPPFYFTSLLSDDHFLAPDASCFPICLKSLSRKRGKHLKDQATLVKEVIEAAATANLSAEARAYLSKLGISNPDADAKTAGLIWIHALAIGYSTAYLSENADGIRMDWPRVPLPASKQTLLASAALGEQSATLLDTEHAVPGVTTGDIRPELKVIGFISREGGGQLQEKELAITAGWGHAGKNDAVMPGKGKIVERDYTPEEKDAIQNGAKNLGMSREQVFSCLGEHTFDIYLNDVAYWRNVPMEVWEYYIGGYQVIKKWLSYREQPLLGRPLNKDEAREVTNMARRIAATLLLQPSLDSNYLKCKENAYPWPKSPA
jgi:hypothetical protein